MERLAVLIIAGLLAAPIVVLGLWSWRRISRADNTEEVLHALQDSLSAAPEVVDQSSALDNGAQERKTPQEDLQSLQPDFLTPSSSHSSVEDLAALVVPAPDWGEVGRTEASLPFVRENEVVPGPHSDLMVLEGDGIALLLQPSSNQSKVTPAQTSAAATSATGDVTPPSKRTLRDSKNEISCDRPSAEQLEPLTKSEVIVALLGMAEDAALESGVDMELEAILAPVLEPAPEPSVAPTIRSKRPVVHRDRRGRRRAIAAVRASLEPAEVTSDLVTRPPAEAKLRLSLHPIRRTARLFVVLTRPDGFPADVTIQAGGMHVVKAYDERRYDDLDLAWTSDLLHDELRLTSTAGFQWLRSVRQVHIFTEDPNESELISVGAAKAGVPHTLVCRSSDVEVVRLAALSTGSSEMHECEYWHGIPGGWVVLSGYMPVRAAISPLPSGLQSLDPGNGLEINFDGGLSIRTRVFAAGHPPRICITPDIGAASVTIGGRPATLSSDGAWTAPEWDAPGQHTVDVVPGPSASYEIVADPWMTGGWDAWDAYPERFGNAAREPWARARICGALVCGPADETVVAAATQQTLIALGPRSGATLLRRRDDVAFSVGLIIEPPVFLLSAIGPRRTQGRVIWLGLVPTQNMSKRYDPEWVSAVRSAVARRLPLEQADAIGEEVWRKAKERARRLRSRRPRT